MNAQDRKELRELFIQFKRWDEWECWQYRPWTAVMVSHDVHGPGIGDLGDLTGIGFSKVSHPDGWDGDFGKALATQKAVAQIVRQMPDQYASWMLSELRKLALKECG